MRVSKLRIDQAALLDNVVQPSFALLYVCGICLGGLVVSVLATGPKVAGSIPAEVDGFLRVVKLRSTTSFVDLRHVKEPYGHRDVS
jgi:hypothetical protein